MDKIIITAAICGAEVTREQSPYIPITAEELALEAKRCVDAGASIIHLHVRRDDGSPTQKLEYFQKAFAAIKRVCPVLPIVQPSTGGAVGMTFEERGEPLALMPEMATLDCGTVNFGNEIFVNDLPMMRKFAKKMQENGVLPELEVFDVGHIHNAILLKKESLLGRMHFDLVLGVQGAINASWQSLACMVGALPAECTYTVAGIGRYETPLAAMTIAIRGNVRVGLDDNIFYSMRRLA